MIHLKYFDELYANHSDPWHYKTRWYEQRKRDITLACLPKQRYLSAIELGCSNGVSTQALATRCNNLLALDGHATAVKLAKQNLCDFLHVIVQKAMIPNDLPKARFDLIVIGEILYYLTANEINQVMVWVSQSLNDEGTLICTHWRYAIQDFDMNGETVHLLINDFFKPLNDSFVHQSRMVDADFLLDVWQRSGFSVAQTEGLVATS